MPDPLDTNDDWAELARELDRSTPPAAPPADMVERRIIEEEAVEPHHGVDPRAEDEAVAQGEPEAAVDEEFEDADEGATAGAEGQPGTGRKRRRRRRRRRKGGPGSPEGAAVGDAAADESEGEVEVEPVAGVEAPEEPEVDDFAAEVAESEPAPAGFEEDTASEVLRDLIANWNVPSWDDIVGGLYRPER